MISVVASNLAFAALKADGTVVSWGDPLRGGNRNLSFLGSEKVIETGSGNEINSLFRIGQVLQS